MKNVLILLGHRQTYKRIALLYECMISDDWRCTFLSLPRGAWNVSALDIPEENLEKTFFTLKMKATEMKGKPDIVVCCHWSLMPIAVLLKLLFGSKLLYEECDYWELEMKTLGTWFQKNVTSFAVKFVKSCFMRFVDLTLCIHLKNSIHLDQLKKLNPNVLEFHNYASRKWAEIPHSDHGTRAGVAFVYMGTLFERKGCRLAAEAFLAAARSTPSFQAEIHFFAQKGERVLINWLARQPGVFVHMRVSPDRIQRFMASRACVGLLVYENNGYYSHVGTNSQKMYEYLAAGVPVIASRVGELEDIVTKNGIGYLVDADIDINGLSKLFISVAADRDDLARRSAKAATFISENRMWCETEWQKVLATGLLHSEKRATQ